MKIKYLPLLNLAENGAVSGILKINKLRIMLDCGINEKYDFSVYKHYQRKIKKVDIILLSHAAIQYTGALPYLFLELDCQAAIYTTLPTSDLSLVTIFDFIINRLNAKLPKDQKMYQNMYKNIASTYDSIHEVKYFQHIVLNIKDNELSIKPYPIGNTIGACAWCISKNKRNILYLVSYNHADEKILNGMAIDKIDEKKIDLLITNSNNIKLKYIKTKEKEKELRNKIESTLKNGGNVVLTCSSTARMYELLLFVLGLFPTKGPWNGPLYLLHTFMGLLHLAHSQIEFMAENLTEEFYLNGENPFRLFIEQNRHEEKIFNSEVKLCRAFDENEIRTPGKLVITNLPNLFYGTGRELLNFIASDEKSTLIFTEHNHLYADIIDGLVKSKTLFIQNEIDPSIFANFEKEVKTEKTGIEVEPTDTATEVNTIITEEEQNQMKEIPMNPLLFGTKKFPVFAFHEHKYRANEYGEFISDELREVFRKHTAKTENVGIDLSGQSLRGQTVITKFESYFFEGNTLIFPKQVNVSNIPFRMKIVNIDMNGLSDGTSMIKTIEQLNPKNIILINGSKDENEYIREKLNNLISGMEIFIPGVRERTIIQLISNMIPTKIDIEHLQSLKLSSVSSKSAEFVMGRLRNHEVVIKRDEGDENKMNIEIVPRSFFTAPTSQEEEKGYEAIGEVELEKFRLILEENNYNTIYKEGVLCIENSIFIKKEDNTIKVEGQFSKEYLDVRNLLYSFTSLQ